MLFSTPLFRVMPRDFEGGYERVLGEQFWSPGGGLLGVGGDLDGQLDAFLQSVARALVNGFHRLDIHAADDQSVLVEAETGTHRQLLVEAKHGRADDAVGVLPKGESGMSVGATPNRSRLGVILRDEYLVGML